MYVIKSACIHLHTRSTRSALYIWVYALRVIHITVVDASNGYCRTTTNPVLRTQAVTYSDTGTFPQYIQVTVKREQQNP